MGKLKLKQRIDALNKLAASQSRKDIDSELKQIRNAYAKAKQNYEAANAELSRIQQEVDNYQVEMNNARQKLVELSDHVQTMDLTGAEGVAFVKDDVFYVIDGKKYHVDKSDISDVKITGYKEYRAQKGQEDSDDDPQDENLTSDISFVNDIFREMNTPRFQ